MRNPQPESVGYRAGRIYRPGLVALTRNLN